MIFDKIFDLAAGVDFYFSSVYINIDNISSQTDRLINPKSQIQTE